MTFRKIRFPRDSNTGNPSAVEIKAIDNGDGTYSFATATQESALPSGASTSALQTSTTAAILAAIGGVAATIILILNAVNGTISTGNSTNVPLDAGATFTGESQSILDDGIIFVNVATDQDSAVDGLSVQQSSDGVNWDHSDAYTICSGCAKNFSINPYAEYMRVVYTNGATPQTYFRLQTIVKSNSLDSSHKIQDSITTDDDARLVKSVITGENYDGDFVNVATTIDGTLVITDNSNGLSIARGNVTGSSIVHKFGFAPDFDTADGVVTVWDGADDSNINQMRYIYSTTAAINSISSSSAADAMVVQLQGLDADYNSVTQTATLNGQNRVTLTTPLIRVFRMKNAGSVDTAGFIYCYENTTLSGGVPVDKTKVRAIVQDGYNQTLMAVYTVPAGYTAYVRDWYASTAGASKDSSYIIELRARDTGGAFQLKHITSISDVGTSYTQHAYYDPEVFGEKVDIEMRVSATALGATGAAISAGFDVVLIENN